jgi:arylsulfatase A-like enzyme
MGKRASEHRRTRREFLKALGLGAVALGGLRLAGARGDDAPGRPNVVFIFIDDMGFADPSCFGNPKLKTPAIDRLAAGGMRFTQFYVNSPICSPSRVAVTTGQYPQRFLIHSFFDSRAENRRRGMPDFLPPDALTIADVFKAAGYATAHFGKWHMGGGRDIDDAPTPAAYGFDEHLLNFEGIGNHIAGPKHTWTQTYVDKTIDFIRRHRDEPFLVRLFPNDVHDNHEPAAGAEDKWKAVTDNPFEQKFFAVLEEMDRQLARVMDELDKLGLAERTLVIFTSDNGPTDWPKYYKQGWTPPGFAGPFRGRKWSLYEGGIRTPFIARWKGRIPAGKTDDKTVLAAIDMLPTICRLVGLAVPNRLDGEDVSAALLGEPVKRKTPIFWEYGRRTGYLKPGNKDYCSPPLAIRDGDWKLLMNQDGGGVELYNLAEDLKESRNLAGSQADVAETLKKKLAAWRAAMPELPAEQQANTKVSIAYMPGKGIITADGKLAPAGGDARPK